MTLTLDPDVGEAVRLVDELAARYADGRVARNGVPGHATVVVDVVRRFWDPPRTRWLLGAETGRFPVLTESAGAISERLSLLPGERRFLSAIDGATTVEAIVASGLLDGQRAAQMLCALALLGLLVFDPDRERDTMQAPPRASTFPPPLLPAIGVERPDPDAAAALFEAGREALRAGLLGKAQRDFERAHRLAPKLSEYDLYAAWVRFCLYDDPDRIRAAIPGMEERVMRVIREDKRVAFAHYVHARMQLLQGNNENALRALRIAVRLDSEDREAQMYCRVLEMRLMGRHQRGA